MRAHLKRLGFDTVYNENVDFYQAIRDNTIPDYDVMVTNPPYSTDPMNHIKRLMKFASASGKPYLILQPVYVYCKQFFITVRR
jgi:methylase of polypeptide subunit release factors